VQGFSFFQRLKGRGAKGAVAIDELKLIDGVLAGDVQAFRPLVESYNRLVFTSVVNILRDSIAAEDIAQEAFLQAFLSLDEFRRESSFSTWLVRIAVNKALDYLRREKARPPVVGLTDAIPSNAPTPENVLLEEEFIWQLREEVQQLPPIYRKVVYDFYFNKLSHREIAAKEGISEKTVESRLYRARGMLRQMRTGGEGDVSTP
jgi:RNA polymerase sigma-70 factor (ECF subfamily)